MTTGNFLQLGGEKIYVSDMKHADPNGEEGIYHPRFFFVNGCNVAGAFEFAPSTILHHFADDSASHCIAPTVTAPSMPASRFAEEFFSNWISGKTAGESMLAATQQLIALPHPIGLFYNYFGHLHLKLTQPVQI